MHTPDRAGFTLIEVLVALALSAIVVLGARALLEGMLRQAQGIARAERTADSVATIDLVAQRIVGNLALADGDAPSFDGDERSARFESWCMTAGGWQERCAVQLIANADSLGGVQLLLQPAAEPIVIGSGRRSALRYLADVGGGGRWVTRWQSSIMPPIAIGVLTGTDTTVLRIGALR